MTLACTAPPEVLRRRVGSRAELGGSDADIRILDEQLQAHAARPVNLSGAIPLSTDGVLSSTLSDAEGIALRLTVGDRRASSR